MEQNFNILIISLTTAIDRQHSVSSQLDKFGLKYEIKLFKRTETTTSNEYNRKKRLRKYGYDMLPGEIGAFLSHRETWKIAKAKNNPTLILEDDFLIQDNSFPEHINSIKEEIPQLGVVRLQAIFDKKTHSIHKVNSLDLVTYTGNPSGATAYLVSPAAASNLYDKSQEIFIPVDDFIDHQWRHEIIIHGLIPYPIGTTDVHSEIGTRNKPKQSLLKKLSIELNKLPDSLRGKWFHMKTKLKYRSSL
ncbi:MAG: glycosyltransferase family 25 protein [Gammaproteobacteria bacterium]|jgi:glycosyl transferase family 25|nr:glycosyltransferase family 25 protein [Gammaproteobacteria bacterium]MBT4130022.1 glycosyltransferase family 25 protein [Candidatus Neomarinimicrobiota bacterium]MBT4607393.1 glycosyltransferase family 25 protein [Thiotrichales bacterium]MBT3843664.1 glycosyltransferase family 25 protein [Gammaproteobacteria bacterium]MBT4810243.1 glycosyltransferase family 25 protein [Thiotrichales bacterium]